VIPLTTGADPSEEPAWLPLTAAQFAVWLACQLDPDSAAYNLIHYRDIHGPVDAQLFEAALRQANVECGTFDVRIDEDVDGPYQLLGQRPAEPLRVLDLSTEADPEGAADKWIQHDRIQPIRLGDRLYVDVLIRLGDDRYRWYMRSHHIVNDGYGGTLFNRRVAELYSAAVQGRESSGVGGVGGDGGAGAVGPLGTLEELVRSDEDYHASEQFVRDRAYWLELLADLPEPPTLAARDRRSAAPGQNAPLFVCAVEPLGAPTRDDLRAAARSARSTWPVLTFAAMGLLLRQKTGMDDILIGVPVSARPAGVRRITPGMIANELPLRLRLAPRMTKAELIQHTNTRLNGLLTHQCFPYDQLRRELKVRRHLFGPSVNILEFTGEELVLGGLRTTARTLDNGPVKDIVVSLYSESDGSLILDFSGFVSRGGVGGAAGSLCRVAGLVGRG
jgi:hypothetical protein